MPLTKSNKEFLTELGKRIQELRKAKGWSQEDFAFRSGLHRNYIGGIERGERNVAAVNLKRIADALNISLQELFSSL